MDLGMMEEIDLYTNQGIVLGFEQTLPFYADKSYLSNTLKFSKYATISENVIGASKLYLSSINGLNDDNVRLSKKIFEKTFKGF